MQKTRLERESRMRIFSTFVQVDIDWLRLKIALIMCSVGVLEGYWGQPLGQISHVPKQPSWFYTLRVWNFFPKNNTIITVIWFFICTSDRTVIALQQHSPLAIRHYPSENWLSSKCLTSVIVQELVFLSVHQPLTKIVASWYHYFYFQFSNHTASSIYFPKRSGWLWVGLSLLLTLSLVLLSGDIQLWFSAWKEENPWEKWRQLTRHCRWSWEEGRWIIEARWKTERVWTTTSTATESSSSLLLRISATTMASVNTDRGKGEEGKRDGIQRRIEILRRPLLFLRWMQHWRWHQKQNFNCIFNNDALQSKVSSNYITLSISYFSSVWRRRLQQE